MTFLGYVFVIMVIIGALFLGIDAFVHTHRYEKWIWQLVIISRLQTTKAIGMDMDELGKDTESLQPSGKYRILITRIWGGLLLVIAVITLCVLIATLVV